MQIPVSLFIYIYAALAFIVLVFSIASVSQVVRFGMNTFVSYLMSAFYLGAVVLVIVTTWLLVRSADWTAAFTIGVPGLGAAGGGL